MVHKEIGFNGSDGLSHIERQPCRLSTYQLKNTYAPSLH